MDTKHRKWKRIIFVSPGHVNHLLRLRRDKKIAATACIVGVVLSTFANSNSHRCWPSRAAIAARAGIDPRHVTRHLRTLERVGFISTEHRYGTSSKYTILAIITPDALGAPPTRPPSPGNFGEAPPDTAGPLKEAIKETTEGTGDAVDDVVSPTVVTPDLVWGCWIKARSEAGMHKTVRSTVAEKAAKKLARSVDEDEITMGELERSMQDYLADDDEFISQRGHGLQFLHSRLDGYLAGDSVDREAEAASLAYADSKDFDAMESAASSAQNKGEHDD